MYPGFTPEFAGGSQFRAFADLLPKVVFMGNGEGVAPLERLNFWTPAATVRTFGILTDSTIPTLFPGIENAPKRAFALEFLKQVIYQQQIYLADNKLNTSLSTQEINDITTKAFVRGEYRPPVAMRASTLSEIATDLTSMENRDKLVNLYASKCADLLRSVLVHEQPYSGLDTEGNLAFEGRTLAALRLLIEGDQEAIDAFKRQSIHIDEKRAIISSLSFMSQSLKDKLVHETSEVLDEHLWLINSALVIDKINPSLGRTMFGDKPITRESLIQILKSFGITEFTTVNDGFGHIGNRQLIQDEQDKWTKFFDEATKIFGTAKHKPSPTETGGSHQDNRYNNWGPRDEHIWSVHDFVVRADPTINAKEEDESEVDSQWSEIYQAMDKLSKVVDDRWQRTKPWIPKDYFNYVGEEYFKGGDHENEGKEIASGYKNYTIKNAGKWKGVTQEEVTDHIWFTARDMRPSSTLVNEDFFRERLWKPVGGDIFEYKVKISESGVRNYDPKPYSGDGELKFSVYTNQPVPSSRERDKLEYITGMRLELMHLETEPKWRTLLAIDSDKKILVFELSKADQSGQIRTYRYNYNPNHHGTTFPYEEDERVEGDPDLELILEILRQRIAWSAWPGWHVSDEGLYGGIGVGSRSLPKGTELGFDLPALLTTITDDVIQLPEIPPPLSKNIDAEA